MSITTNPVFEGHVKSLMADQGLTADFISSFEIILRTSGLTGAYKGFAIRFYEEDEILVASTGLITGDPFGFAAELEMRAAFSNVFDLML